MELPKADELKALVSALAPGIIILGIRQPFLSRPEPDVLDRAFRYAAISAVYYAIIHPALLTFHNSFGLLSWSSNVLEYIVIPAIVGIIAAVAIHKDLTFKIWRHFSNEPPHRIPTAWDYAFSRMKKDVYLIVTMSDGSQVAGHYCGDESFSSSSNSERDLLIGEVWNLDGDTWSKPADPRSILLCGRDIKHIEFIQGSNQ